MHPEATRNHYQPLIASSHYLAIITSFKSLFLIFGNFEPVLHWSRWVLSVVSVVEEVEEASNPGLYPVEVLLLLIDIKAWRLNFRTIEPVLHPSRWVEAVEAVADRPIQVYLHWKEVLLVIVDIHWISRRLSRSYTQVAGCMEEEKLLPLSAVSTMLHLLPKKKDLFGSSLSGWIEFRDFCTSLTFKSLSLEASNQGIFPVMSLLGTCSQRLNWPPTLLKFQDVWAGLTLKLLSV